MNIQGFKSEQAIMAKYKTTKGIQRPVERSEAAKAALEKFFDDPEENQIPIAQQLAGLISERKQQEYMLQRIQDVQKTFAKLDATKKVAIKQQVEQTGEPQFNRLKKDLKKANAKLTSLNDIKNRLIKEDKH